MLTDGGVVFKASLDVVGRRRFSNVSPCSLKKGS